MQNPLTIDGTLPLTPSKTPITSTPPPGAHGAVAPKPMSVHGSVPIGVAVNPGNTSGGSRGSYPYKPSDTEYAVESGTHA